MIWAWTIALLVTLVALAVAWRAIARADAAVGALRVATGSMGAVDAGSAALTDELAWARRGRAQVADRAIESCK